MPSVLTETSLHPCCPVFFHRGWQPMVHGAFEYNPQSCSFGSIQRLCLRATAVHLGLWWRENFPCTMLSWVAGRSSGSRQYLVPTHLRPELRHSGPSPKEVDDPRSSVLEMLEF